jgi:HJR/Mrr/RecB family endonuclease
MWHKVDVRYFCSNKLKGLQFETAVMKTMKHIGCELAATKESKDGGVDHQVSTTMCI